MRAELRHLRVLARLATDPKVLAEIDLLVQELERRIRRGGNGEDA
jgi:hypothetical protein